jgi:hypothetical protein
MGQHTYPPLLTGAERGVAYWTSIKDQEDRVDKTPVVCLAAPCGLYCGICPDCMDDECHGCGCTCGKCAGQRHEEGCAIAQCVGSWSLESCAQCEELPCTRLIQFTVDPIWRTHLPCIENLRRRGRIGTEAWLQEQEAYWRQERRRNRWISLFEECSRRWREEGHGEV